jgi:hypothetical protein
VAEEHDEALDIADDIYKGRITRIRGAAKIRAHRDLAVAAAKAEERRAWVEALATGNRETGLGKDVMEHGASAMAEHVTEVTKLRIKQAVAETKARAEAAEAKVKTLASLINSEVVASMSTPDGLKPINSTGMRYAVDKWGSAEAKVKALEAKLAATEDWDARYRAAISCMKRVLSSQFGITGLAQASPAYPYADAIEAGIERLRQELRRKDGVLDKFREAARGL